MMLAVTLGWSFAGMFACTLIIAVAPPPKPSLFCFWVAVTAMVNLYCSLFVFSMYGGRGTILEPDTPESLS